MDVQRKSRERVFSILNDNDSPSFVIRQKQTCPSPSSQKLPSISSLTAFAPSLERPNLARQPQFHRNDSISSTGSPPLLRYDSSSSSKSSRSMDSTPSPITPAYQYNDTTLVPYDSLLRQDPTMAYLPSPTTGITPFMDQALMIGPVPQDAFAPKAPLPLAPATYPAMHGAPSMPQMPTPALSANTSVSSTSSANQPPRPTTGNNAGTPQPKKNKYPCPYAQSHHCAATFTTSGHAARHGKKHTGEKGVHCPICDKAFTRKDNMKQHERTHRNKPGKEDEKKSKAQATREANRAKESQTPDETRAPAAHQTSQHPAHLRKTSSGHSAPSDVTLAAISVNTPVNISPSFFPDPAPQIVLPPDSALTGDMLTASMYPALGDEGLPVDGAVAAGSDKLDVPVPQPPTLVRGFSDLDTLAQAAETFDPYFQQPQF